MLDKTQLERIKVKAKNTWIYNDIVTLLLEIERLNTVVGLALEYAYDESNGHCRGCTVDDGRHDDDCPVAAIEKISGSED